MKKKHGKPKKEDLERLGGKKKDEFMQYKLEFDCYQDKLCIVTPEVEDEQRKIVKDSQPLSSRRQQRS
jgi:hypothetical protein